MEFRLEFSEEITDLCYDVLIPLQGMSIFITVTHHYCNSVSFLLFIFD